MAGLLSALLLSVGLGSAIAPPPALPTISAPAPPSSLAESVAAPAYAPSAADPHLAVPYFGARYYGSKIGRFTSVDPLILRQMLPEPQRWNRYGYALNNPLRVTDPDGRWPTHPKDPVHQNSIDDALPWVSGEDRQTLKDAVLAADSPELQDDRYAHRHGMRGPHQTVAQAREDFNAFVGAKIAEARRLEKQGDHRGALTALGFAMHALQDATSPAHIGFQEWRTEWQRSKEGALHLALEIRATGDWKEDLDQSTLNAWDYFNGVQGLPEDFAGSLSLRIQP